MKAKEPKFMQELHKVRERLSKRWQKLSKADLLRELNSYKLHTYDRWKFNPDKVVHRGYPPLMTASGFTRATRRASPASSTTLTTLSTSL